MSRLGFAIDRGGTFTDVIVFKGNDVQVKKVLSVDPDNYQDAPTEAIRQVLEQETGKKIPRGTPLPTELISWIRMGTTVATNALLERKGERVGLLITKGFRDLLFIGNQSRPDIFAFNIVIPEVLYEDVIEVDERVLPSDETCQMTFKNSTIETADNGKKIIVEKTINEEQLREQIEQFKKKGIQSVAVLFLHSFIYPDHELQAGKIVKEAGFKHVSLSHKVMPMIKAVSRGFTVAADAYLTPKIIDYINGFKAGFQDLSNTNVNFMQSDGGLCHMDSFSGSRAILSGPAGGVVGVAATAYDGTPVIGFDMGGTSTDVCRYSGALEHVMETTTAGVTIQAAQLDVRTVAAGGGSRLFFRDGLFIVGPESASAHPGPVCYRKNGYLTVTDANVVLGRLLPDHFPFIFGPNADQPLDRDASIKAMTSLTAEVNSYVSANPESVKKSYTVEEVALGFVSVANEEMCRPIRALTQSRGYDPSSHVLSCFGGAGGQHACAVAKSLGISKVKIHKYASLLSAYGIALADVVTELQTPLHITYQEENYTTIATKLAIMIEVARNNLAKDGFTDDVNIDYLAYLHMRYDKTDSAIMITSSFDPKNPKSLDSFKAVFEENYKREFGFILDTRDIIVDDVRIRGVGKSNKKDEKTIEKAENPNEPPVHSKTPVFFTEGLLESNVYLLKALKHGHVLQGPALLIDKNSTIVIPPESAATITEHGNVEVEVVKQKLIVSEKVDPIRLAIFSNRFMSIAEQMGKALQRTSISTNIKERLDFSCAMFGPDGGLIANAPHIPVHLGGMQYTVKFQIDHLGLDGIEDGDVILANHPRAGGSHLPDFTIITPVYFKQVKDPVFFVANRGHHADIGGLVPGSMPPFAHNINQEGAAFISFKVIKKGVFQEEALVDALRAPGKFPGCSAARNIPDNISDIKAQIAANRKGTSLICALIEEYSLEVVLAYMKHIQATAEESVRSMLQKVAGGQKKRLEASDHMDDGTEIKLAVEIDGETGSATFDFTGTGSEVYHSTNAPRAVTMSAVTYCLRCLVRKDIPLNNGCLAPITIILPPRSILAPSDDAAVVAGNVLTSQRVCDVIFKAFDVVAASQGCCNNLIFGDDKMGYYETIAGGSGAGDGFHGRSGVHTHMTNTRITDPEILETRYPVLLREWKLRSGSGGLGKWKGGEGVIRKLQFRRPVTLSLLSERRSLAPYGLKGGGPGSRGLNLLHREGKSVNIGSKVTMNIETEDILEINTPGGGGYGII